MDVIVSDNIVYRPYHNILWLWKLSFQFFFLEFNMSIYIFIYLYFCDENLSQVLCYYLVTNGELETFWDFNRGLLSNKCKTLNFLNCNTPRLNSLLNLAPIIQHSLRLFQSNCPLKFQKVEKITSFFLVT